MTPPPPVDSISPQTPLVAAAATRLATTARSVGANYDRLLAVVREEADAQPAMAAFIALGTRVLLVAKKAQDEEASEIEAVERVTTAIAAWSADFAAAGDAIVEGARELVPASGWIATTTRSSLVERALLHARSAGVPLNVIASESRPMYEGRLLASALAESSVTTWMTTDGALGLLLPQAGALWLGADAIREKTFVTKAGTYALLLLARELNLPAYVLAQRAKFLPDRCRRLTLPRLDPDEVWSDAPGHVRVVNLPFEEVPLALVRGVRTEGGFLGAREVEDAAGVAQVAPELLAPSPPA